MKPLGDRRLQVRLEIVGSLWGTLEFSHAGRLVNISPTGALVASPIAMTPNSTQVVKLTVAGSELTLEARVRHLRPMAARPQQPPEYLVGLEFLAVPAALTHALE